MNNNDLTPRLAEKEEHTLSPQKMAYQKKRLESIDLLRGIILIIMALDHTRGYLSSVINPLDLTTTTPLLFFTRWITHLCAPLFIFLAGVSAYLYANSHGRTLKDTAYFLFTRGIWFIFFDLFLMYFVWTLGLAPFRLTFGVFWAIGASMIILSGLIFLPFSILLTLSLGTLFGHNLLDSISAESWGNGFWMWNLLHEKNTFSTSFLKINIIYPIIPWFAVMSLGFCLGKLFTFPEKQRRRYFLSLGALSLLGFVLLRLSNLYGDAQLWSEQSSVLYTIMSFINCTKYPPSLLYLMMTLGVGFIFLGVIKESICTYSFSQKVLTFGRVPFLFYVLHILSALIIALVLAYWVGGTETLLHYFEARNTIGYDLLMVYLAWCGIIIALYRPCHRYAHFKAHTKNRLFSYL